MINVNQMMDRVNAAAADAMGDAMEHLLTEARKVTPIEEGTLERGGTATTAAQGDEVVGAVAFHGPYAVRQHEDTGLRHDAGRKAKYLEDTALQEQPTIAEILAQGIRGEL